MRVREKTIRRIAEISQRIEWLRSLGDGYSDEVERLEERITRLQTDLDHYDQEAAEGYKKPSRWRWKKNEKKV